MVLASEAEASAICRPAPLGGEGSISRSLAVTSGQTPESGSVRWEISRPQSRSQFQLPHPKW
eukprot:3940927-Rhodomonas_salina.8